MSKPPDEGGDDEETTEALYQIEREDLVVRSRIYSWAGCTTLVFGGFLLSILTPLLPFQIPVIGRWWAFPILGFLALYAVRHYIPLYVHWKAGRYELPDGTRLRGAKAKIVIYWLAVIITAMGLLNFVITQLLARR